MSTRRFLLHGWLTLLAAMLVMYCLLEGSILGARATGALALVGGHFLLWRASKSLQRPSVWTDRAGWLFFVVGALAQYRYFIDGYIESSGLLWLVCSWGLSLTLFAWGLAVDNGLRQNSQR